MDELERNTGLSVGTGFGPTLTDELVNILSGNTRTIISTTPYRWNTLWEHADGQYELVLGELSSDSFDPLLFGYLDEADATAVLSGVDSEDTDRSFPEYSLAIETDPEVDYFTYAPFVHATAANLDRNFSKSVVTELADVSRSAIRSEGRNIGLDLASQTLGSQWTLGLSGLILGVSFGTAVTLPLVGAGYLVQRILAGGQNAHEELAESFAGLQELTAPEMELLESEFGMEPLTLERLTTAGRITESEWSMLQSRIHALEQSHNELMDAFVGASNHEAVVDAFETMGDFFRFLSQAPIEPVESLREDFEQTRAFLTNASLPQDEAWHAVEVDEVEAIGDAIREQRGIVLVRGSFGAGKSTAVYTAARQAVEDGIFVGRTVLEELAGFSLQQIDRKTVVIADYYRNPDRYRKLFHWLENGTCETLVLMCQEEVYDAMLFMLQDFWRHKPLYKHYWESRSQIEINGLTEPALREVLEQNFEISDGSDIETIWRFSRISDGDGEPAESGGYVNPLAAITVADQLKGGSSLDEFEDPSDLLWSKVEHLFSTDNRVNTVETNPEKYALRYLAAAGRLSTADYIELFERHDSQVSETYLAELLDSIPIVVRSENNYLIRPELLEQIVFANESVEELQNLIESLGSLEKDKPLIHAAYNLGLHYSRLSKRVEEPTAVVPGDDSRSDVATCIDGFTMLLDFIDSWSGLLAALQILIIYRVSPSEVDEERVNDWLEDIEVGCREFWEEMGTLGLQLQQDDILSIDNIGELAFLHAYTSLIVASSMTGSPEDVADWIELIWDWLHDVVPADSTWLPCIYLLTFRIFEERDTLSVRLAWIGWLLEHTTHLLERLPDEQTFNLFMSIRDILLKSLSAESRVVASPVGDHGYSKADVVCDWIAQTLSACHEVPAEDASRVYELLRAEVAGLTDDDLREKAFRRAYRILVSSDGHSAAISALDQVTTRACIVCASTIDVYSIDAFGNTKLCHICADCWECRTESDEITRTLHSWNIASTEALRTCFQNIIERTEPGPQMNAENDARDLTIRVFTRQGGPSDFVEAIPALGVEADLGHTPISHVFWNASQPPQEAVTASSTATDWSITVLFVQSAHPDLRIQNFVVCVGETETAFKDAVVNAVRTVYESEGAYSLLEDIHVSD